MLWRRQPYEPGAYDDDWEDQPAQGPLYQWGLGVLVPALMLGGGIRAIVAREVTMEYARTPLPLHGTNAVALGVAGISAAVFLHCHYYWGNVYNQAWFAVLGKIVGACGFIAGIGSLLVRVGVLGRG